MFALVGTSASATVVRVNVTYLNIQNVVPPEQFLKISFFVDTGLQIPPISQSQRYCFT